MSKGQKLIYASTASVYGNTNGQTVDETYINNNTSSYYDLTKKFADEYASFSNIEYYGLRFGTVNGKIKESHLVRDDLIINAMTKNSIMGNKINCINLEVNRGILGMTDLCNAVKTILDNSSDNRGIYNLSSFNTTVGDIASYVSNRFNTEIEFKKDDKIKLYDFS